MIESLGKPLTAEQVRQVLGMSREEKLGVTPAYLHENFYCEDGKLFRKAGHGSRRLNFWEWSIRGPYRRIKIKGAQFQVHRLIWIMHNGFIPVDKVIDHINREQLDNRIENLRCVTHRQNMLNKEACDARDKYIYWQPRNKKWRVMCSLHGKKRHYGMFRSYDDAICAGMLAARDAELVA